MHAPAARPCTPAPLDRREFLKSAAALTALAALPLPSLGAAAEPARRARKPAVVRGAFFYPPEEDVLAGRCEDSWAGQKWFTWPGNQFRPEQQQAKFLAAVRDIARDLDLDLRIEEAPLHTDAAIRSFLEDATASKPDALLLFNFWNSFSAKLKPVLEAFPGPVILYHPVGANHQLPPEHFRTAKRTQYIHSIENVDALARGLRSVHARNAMAQSRLLRVSGRLAAEADDREPLFGTPIHGVPAEHFNKLFDELPASPEMARIARAIRSGARRVTDLSAEAFLDAARAHLAVRDLMGRHEADAITIECLFLKHRKPCLSFALNNGELRPCGCENDLNATITLMLGAQLFGRGGFQHNPEFDTEENLYFASHCTCATRLHGPKGGRQAYDLRPFFHQMPKSVALDVQWPAGEPATMVKYHSGKTRLDAWVGDIVSSPSCPPTGGCATRVLVKMRDVADVCSVYPGPHPVLYCGDFGRQAAVFARLYELDLHTNAPGLPPPAPPAA
jgi:hypothetical protein